MVVGLNPIAVTKTLDIVSVLSKEFFKIQATTEYIFTLNRVCDIIRTHIQLGTLNNKLDCLGVRLSNILKKEVHQNKK